MYKKIRKSKRRVSSVEHDEYVISLIEESHRVLSIVIVDELHSPSVRAAAQIAGENLLLFLDELSGLHPEGDEFDELAEA
ncbi:hypothetical protein [Fulvimarina manganoxydans]|uniref:hypothetical protein n=1 Tax=Fulvimarina manganoxydans TaxID=937218 RepID=UPI00111C7D6D|nr:hypothetical protein [Fulvimarina manganoxydans]